MDVLKFKQAMSKYPSGIAIVTIIDDQGKMGLTLSTFNSLSLDPLLIMFSLAKKAARYQRLVEAENFAINILSDSQAEVSKLFAVNQEVDWDKLGFSNSTANHSPLIRGISAYFDCKLHNIVDGGDHIIVIGKVVEAEYFDEDPLIYHDRKYKKLES